MLETKQYHGIRDRYIYGGVSLEQAAQEHCASIVAVTALAARDRWHEARAMADQLRAQQSSS